MKPGYNSKNTAIFSRLQFPDPGSHKGQNGRLLLIGGSHLFHAASLWALTIASRIVDLVHYASVPENNAIVTKAKQEFRSGIVIPRSDIESYIAEDDAILIGPGMNRATDQECKPYQYRELLDLQDVATIPNEGVQTYLYTNYLLYKYPQKQWILDAGALQMVDPKNIPYGAIVTPHAGEFWLLWGKMNKTYKPTQVSEAPTVSQVKELAADLRCVVLAKGVTDIIADGRKTGQEHTQVAGGNAGMTKGGTGDVLAGLVAALVTKHDPFVSAVCASIINKQAGDDLHAHVGPYFNASDLANQIPQTMAKLVKKNYES